MAAHAPDRIIGGECRGAEATDMLQAMNTGHEGGAEGAGDDEKWLGNV